jgi:hypothetical protein
MGTIKIKWHLIVTRTVKVDKLSFIEQVLLYQGAYDTYMLAMSHTSHGWNYRNL